MSGFKIYLYMSLSWCEECPLPNWKNKITSLRESVIRAEREIDCVAILPSNQPWNKFYLCSSKLLLIIVNTFLNSTFFSYAGLGSITSNLEPLTKDSTNRYHLHLCNCSRQKLRGHFGLLFLPHPPSPWNINISKCISNSSTFINSPAIIIV